MKSQCAFRLHQHMRGVAESQMGELLTVSEDHYEQTRDIEADKEG